MRLHWPLILVCVICLSGCVSTAKVTHSWVDPNEPAPQMESMLVVAVTHTLQAQLVAENTMVEKLSAQGIEAVASHTMGSEPTRESLAAFAEKEGLESILVLAYAGSEESEVYQPGTIYYGIHPTYFGYYGNLWSYYPRIYEISRVPGYYTNNKFLFLIANLYDANSKEIVWNAVSKARQEGDPFRLLNPFLQSFVDQLTKDKLIASRAPLNN